MILSSIVIYCMNNVITLNSKNKFSFCTYVLLSKVIKVTGSCEFCEIALK